MHLPIKFALKMLLSFIGEDAITQCTHREHIKCSSCTDCIRVHISGSVRAYFICHFVVNCASLWCFKNKSSAFDAFDMVLIATGVCWLFGSTFVALCFIVVVQCGGDFTWNNAFFANLVAIVNYLLCARQVRGPSR